MITKKRLKLKNEVKDILCISVFYAILILSVVLLNMRFEYLEQQKSTDEITAQTVQVIER